MLAEFRGIPRIEIGTRIELRVASAGGVRAQPDERHDGPARSSEAKAALASTNAIASRKVWPLGSRPSVSTVKEITDGISSTPAALAAAIS